MVPADVRRRHDYFEDELVKTLAGGDASPLLNVECELLTCYRNHRLTAISNLKSAMNIEGATLVKNCCIVRRYHPDAGARCVGARPDAQNDVGAIQSAALLLAPTNHPRIPGDLNLLWLAPVRSIEMLPSSREIATAIKLVDKGDGQGARDAFAASVQDGPLAVRSLLRRAAQQGLKQHEQARDISRSRLAADRLSGRSRAIERPRRPKRWMISLTPQHLHRWPAVHDRARRGSDALGRAARAADDSRKPPRRSAVCTSSSH